VEATSLSTLILWNTIVNLPTTDEQQGVVLYERRKRPNSSEKLSTRDVRQAAARVAKQVFEEKYV
jgi:hypothetical protein